MSDKCNMAAMATGRENPDGTWHGMMLCGQAKQPGSQGGTQRVLIPATSKNGAKQGAEGRFDLDRAPSPSKMAA